MKLFCMYDKRFAISMEWRRKQNHKLNNLPKVKIFSTLQVHHLNLAIIIHNKNISLLLYNPLVVYQKEQLLESLLSALLSD